MFSIHNTDRSFGAVAKTFHWAIVLLILAAYVSVLSLDFFVPSTPDWRRILRIHQWIGFTIFALVIARLYWRVASKHPSSLSTSRLERTAADTAHFLLYFLLLTMPLTGWAGGKANRTFFGLFEIPSFYHLPIQKPIVEGLLRTDWNTFETVMDFYHYRLVGPYVLSVLIGIHIAAALYHHFIRRDDVLARMLPGAAAKRARAASISEPSP